MNTPASRIGMQHAETEPRRGLMALFSDLWRETSTLVHAEAELAKAELSEKVTQVQTGIAEIAVGGAIVFAGFIVLLMAASNGLTRLLPEAHADWLAPLIVGLAVIVLGFIALARGRHELKARSLAPERTLTALRDDARMARGHVS